MKILAIETSCDETAISIVEATGDEKTPNIKVLSSVLLSQAKLHAKYGGVFPNIARREHEKALVPLLKKALVESKMLKTRPRKNHSQILENLRMILGRETELLNNLLKFIPTIETPSINAVAVTSGPGLEPALWVGINFARALGTTWKLPIYPINHMEGHIVAALLKKETNNNYKLTKIKTPALALLVSGGHTELVEIKKFGKYKKIGETKDDAAGEAFDKAARILGLGYPGGPEISRLAEIGRKNKTKSSLPLPRPMIKTKNFDFSFSGLKTAVLYTVQKIKNLTKEKRLALALEFENAITEVLLAKTTRAIREKNIKTLIIGGGVSANTHIRREFEKACRAADIPLYLPNRDLSTDNALMIAATAALHIKSGKKPTKKITASGRWSI